jgi:hypothetical protein
LIGEVVDAWVDDAAPAGKGATADTAAKPNAITTAAARMQGLR